MMSPAQFLDHDGAPKTCRFSVLVAELDAPTAELIEAVRGINQVLVKGIAPHLAIGDHVDPGERLRFQRFVDSAVLEMFELRRRDLSLLVAAARLHQVGRAQEATNHLALRLHGFHRPPVLHLRLHRLDYPYFSGSGAEPYRVAMSFSEAVRRIESGAGNQFDPAVIRALRSRSAAIAALLLVMGKPRAVPLEVLKEPAV